MAVKRAAMPAFAVMADQDRLTERDVLHGIARPPEGCIALSARTIGAILESLAPGL